MRTAESLIAEDDSIPSALQVIDQASSSRAFVADTAGRLVGATDESDIGRALLDGAGLDSPSYPLVQDTGSRPGR